MKKVDFLDWKQENNLRESAVVAKYGLSDRDEYLKVVNRLLPLWFV